MGVNPGSDAGAERLNQFIERIERPEEKNAP